MRGVLGLVGRRIDVRPRLVELLLCLPSLSLSRFRCVWKGDGSSYTYPRGSDPVQPMWPRCMTRIPLCCTGVLLPSTPYGILLPYSQYYILSIVIPPPLPLSRKKWTRELRTRKRSSIHVPWPLRNFGMASTVVTILSQRTLGLRSLILLSRTTCGVLEG